jgi:hypothetical protein
MGMRANTSTLQILGARAVSTIQASRRIWKAGKLAARQIWSVHQPAVGLFNHHDRLPERAVKRAMTGSRLT